MNLSGALTDWTVTDLLSMLTVTRKTATLRVEGQRCGAVHFSDGRVLGAALDDEPSDPTSRSATADALFALSGLEGGTFAIGPYIGPDSVGWSVEELTADMGQLERLQADLSTGGLTSVPLILREEIEGPVTIAAEDWWAIASLVSVLSLDQLEAVFGTGRATRLLHTLWRLDLIEVIEADEEEVVSAGEIEAHTNEAVEAEEPLEGPFVIDDTPAIKGSTPDDDAWLDEIAASAGGDLSGDAARSRLTGVAAPASTVLTGSVLDEMRRLRSRPSSD